MKTFGWGYDGCLGYALYRSRRILLVKGKRISEKKYKLMGGML
ncbi:MAG: hypothetical protein ABIK26_01120 [Candidatus Omnitrophota bacterium]